MASYYGSNSKFISKLGRWLDQWVRRGVLQYDEVFLWERSWHTT